MTNAESLCREMAELFPTPNVRRTISLCESGRVTWEQAQAIFTEALIDTLCEMKEKD